MPQSLDARRTTAPLWPLEARLNEKAVVAKRFPGGMTPRDRERVWQMGFRAGYEWHKPSWDNPYLESTIWHQVWAEGYARGAEKGRA